MNASVLLAVIELELRQRVRSVAWYVLLGVFAVVLLGVELLVIGIVGSVGSSSAPSVFPVVVYFVLLLGVLVTPALSGASVNADRDAGTLATTQVTRVTTGQLLAGKFLAAWAASLAFLVVAVPFLVVALVVGHLPFGVVGTSLGVTAIELGVIAALGVGFSAIVPRPIFSVVTTYLVVAALAIGTLIAFGLGAFALQTTTTTTYISQSDDSSDAKTSCGRPDVEVQQVPRPDRVWWLLAPNPFVVLADAVPTNLDAAGGPADAFTTLKVGIRLAQIAPRDHEVFDACDDRRSTHVDDSPRHVLATTAPSWFVGLLLQVVLSGVVLAGAYRALRTPSRRIARGSRIA